VCVKRDPNARNRTELSTTASVRSSSFVLKNQHSGDKTKGNARDACVYMCAHWTQWDALLSPFIRRSPARPCFLFFLPFFFFLVSRTALRFRVRMTKLSKNDASVYTPILLVPQAKRTIFDQCISIKEKKLSTQEKNKFIRKRSLFKKFNC
jgi:hypothetical protein